jgi:hypothetical protein
MAPTASQSCTRAPLDRFGVPNVDCPGSGFPAKSLAGEVEGDAQVIVALSAVLTSIAHSATARIRIALLLMLPPFQLGGFCQKLYLHSLSNSRFVV